MMYFTITMQLIFTWLSLRYKILENRKSCLIIILSKKDTTNFFEDTSAEKYH